MVKRAGDGFYHKAKQKGFLARSIFKLEEINKKFHIFLKRNNKNRFIALDLGASPGSWLQYSSSCLLNTDLIIGVDLNPVKFQSKNVIFFQRNVFDLNVNDILKYTENNLLDLLMSDMAPKTTGIRVKDHYNSFELVSKALDIAKFSLKKDAFFICKIFDSQYADIFINNCQKHFKKVKRYKPKSSRSESYETYIISEGFIGG